MFSGVGVVTVISMYISTRNLERGKVLLAKAVTVLVGLVAVGGNAYGFIDKIKCK